PSGSASVVSGLSLAWRVFAERNAHCHARLRSVLAFHTDSLLCRLRRLLPMIPGTNRIGTTSFGGTWISDRLVSCAGVANDRPTRMPSLSVRVPIRRFWRSSMSHKPLLSAFCRSEQANRDFLDPHRLLQVGPAVGVRHALDPGAVGTNDLVAVVRRRFAVALDQTEAFVELRLRPAVHLPRQLRRSDEHLASRMHLDRARAG